MNLALQINTRQRGLTVEVVKSLEGVRALEAEWLALEARLPSLPFVTFDWFVSWWEHLAERRLLVKDELFVLTFRDSKGELMGIAPLMITQRPGLLVVSTRQLQLFGADPNLTEIRSLVVPAAQRGPVYEALMLYLQAHSHAWDWFLLTGVPDDPQLTEIVASPFPRADWLQPTPNFILDLPNSFEALKASLSRNTKEALRKCYNSLKRDGLSFEFEVLTQVDQVEPALADFFRLHRIRSELTDTVAHPNAFAAERSRQFLTTVCKRFAARGKLRVFQLRIAGRVVACRLAFVCGDALYLYYSGYEPEFGQYSVMTTLLAEAIRYAIDSGLTSVNLSIGRDASKLRWAPRQTDYLDARIVSPSLRGAVAHDVSSFAAKTFQVARKQTGALNFLARRSV